MIATFVCRSAGEEGLLCRRWCGDKGCTDAPPQVDGTASAQAYQSATPAGALPSKTPRTDAWEQTSAPYADLIELARCLERELAGYKRELKDLRRQIRNLRDGQGPQ